MIVCDNNLTVKPTQFDSKNNGPIRNSEAIEQALNQLIQHAVIYEEAKKKLKLLG